MKKPPRLSASCFRAGSLAILAALVFAGCLGPHAMKTSFNQYSEAYADLSNEQMLLNLARRANNHPAYFLQMGGINSSFNFSRSVSAGGGGALQSVPGPVAVVQRLWNGSGSINLNAGEQPTFSITPLSGSTFAAAIFNPIGSSLLFNLYDQGAPVDQLLRSMVQAVEFSWPDGVSQTIMNIVDRDRPESYKMFLRFAGLARELQKRQVLVITNDAGQPRFALTSEADRVIGDLIKADPTLDFDPNPRVHAGKRSIGFKIRTFEGVLTALAREQRLFDDLASTQPNFLKEIPASQGQPILRITWDGIKAPLTPSVTEVSYRSKKYIVADRQGGPTDAVANEAQTWNRNVFILLNHLFTQIALDPGKLPVQQLIRVQ